MLFSLPLSLSRTFSEHVATSLITEQARPTWTTLTAVHTQLALHCNLHTHTHTYLHGYLHKRFYAVPPQQASLHALHLRVTEGEREGERDAGRVQKRREMLIDSKVSHEVNAVNDSNKHTHTHYLNR